jgi:uncharacterized protein YoxC
MSRSANVHSVEAVRHFKVVLQQYVADVGEALTDLVLEARRAVDWIENDRSRYWPAEFRRSSDAVSESRVALERCEITISPDDRRPCHDERKALELAKRRLRKAEEMLHVVRKWRVKVKHDAEDFEGQVAKLNQFLDSDIPRAVAALERMSTALDRYVTKGPADADGTTPPASLQVAKDKIHAKDKQE